MMFFVFMLNYGPLYGKHKAACSTMHTLQAVTRANQVNKEVGSLVRKAMKKVKEVSEPLVSESRRQKKHRKYTYIYIYRVIIALFINVALHFEIIETYMYNLIHRYIHIMYVYRHVFIVYIYIYLQSGKVGIPPTSNMFFF